MPRVDCTRSGRSDTHDALHISLATDSVEHVRRGSQTGGASFRLRPTYPLPSQPCPSPYTHCNTTPDTLQHVDGPEIRQRYAAMSTASATRLTVPAKLDDVTRILSTLEADLDAPKLSPPRTLPPKHHTSSTHHLHRTTAAARAAQDLRSRSHKLGSHLHRECRLSRCAVEEYTVTCSGSSYIRPLCF
jgi:hypothetical protein